MRLAAPIHKGVSSGVLIAVPNLIARLSGYPKLLTQTAHGLPIQQPRYESHSLVHHTGLLPWHLWAPPKRSLMCYLCVRYNLLPISRNGHRNLFLAQRVLGFHPDSHISILGKIGAFLAFSVAIATGEQRQRDDQERQKTLMLQLDDNYRIISDEHVRSKRERPPFTAISCDLRTLRQAIERIGKQCVTLWGRN